MIRLALLSALAIAALPVPAAARAVAAPAIAAEMELSARVALKARCGSAPRCALYGSAPDAAPVVRIAGMSCRERKSDHVRTRRCSFTAISPGQSKPLSCSAIFNQGPGTSPAIWSDRELVRQVRVYLPTSNMNAPLTLGPSTLSCSGSVTDYVS